MLEATAFVLTLFLGVAFLGFLIGLIYPPAGIFWAERKTRKDVVRNYVFVFLLILILLTLVAPQLNLQNRSIVLVTLAIMALAISILSPYCIMPWSDNPTLKSALKICVPVLLAMGAFLLYANLKSDVDPRYALSTTELSLAHKKDIIKYTVAKEISGKTNLNQNRIREITVDYDPNGRYLVNVELNSNHYVLARLIKDAVLKDMARVYKTLYTAGFNIQEVEVSSYLPTKIEEVESSSTVAMTTSLDRYNADRIEWSTGEDKLAKEVLPARWTLHSIHSKLK